MRTIVHILGCHLQAKRVDGSIWKQIVWGDGTRKGRLVQGLYVAVEEYADTISFGTGASKIDDIKEAEYTYLYACDHMTELDITTDHRRFLESRLGREDVVLDCESQNTTEEVRKALSLAGDGNTIYFVTSAFHASRAVNEVTKAQRDLFPIGRGPRTRIVSALDDPGGTIVVEEPHRGDLTSIDFPGTIKNIFQFLRYPETAEKLRDDFERAIEARKTELD